MESNNSQFEEVPAEEATEAESSGTPKKPSKSKAAAAPEGWTGPEAKEETTIGSDLSAGGGVSPFAPDNFEWMKDMDRRGGSSSIAAAERAVKAYSRNKLNLNVFTEPSGDEGTEDSEGSGNIDSETAHYGGGHGLQGVATAEEMSDLPYSHRALMFANADHCDSCKKNAHTYVNEVLAGQHENGQHRPTDARKNPGENLDPYCEGCVADLDSKVSKHGNHSRYPSIFRILFRNKGCAQCEQSLDAQIAEEHTLGHHSGDAENRHPRCGECAKLDQADAEAAAESNPLKKDALARRQTRSAQLTKLAITRELAIFTGKPPVFPPLTEKEQKTGATQKIVDTRNGSYLHTRPAGSSIPIKEPIPHALDPVVSRAVANTIRTGMRRARYRQGRDSMQSRLVSMGREDLAPDEEQDEKNRLVPTPDTVFPNLGLRPSTTRLDTTLLPKGRKATETEAGTSVTDEELAAYHGNPEEGTPGIKEGIPRNLRHLWENPVITPSHSQRRESEAAAREAAAQRVQQETAQSQASNARTARMDAEARARDAAKPEVTSTYTGPVVRGRGPVPRGPMEALNCSSCGTMISPVRGAADPITGEAPQELCRNCRNEAINPDLPTQSKLNPKRRNSSIEVSDEATRLLTPNKGKNWYNTLSVWKKQQENKQENEE